MTSFETVPPHPRKQPFSQPLPPSTQTTTSATTPTTLPMWEALSTPLAVLLLPMTILPPPQLTKRPSTAPTARIPLYLGAMLQRGEAPEEPRCVWTRE